MNWVRTTGHQKNCSTPNLKQGMTVHCDIIVTKQEAFLLQKRGGCHEERTVCAFKDFVFNQRICWN